MFHRTWQRLLVIIIAIPLLFLASDWVIGAAPLRVEIAKDGATLTLRADTQEAVTPIWIDLTDVAFLPADPSTREYAIDGSDSTTLYNLDADYISSISDTLYYRAQSALRDDSSFSRWQNIRLRDLSEPTDAPAVPVNAEDGTSLPSRFSLSMELLRPEIARLVQFDATDGSSLTLEIDRAERSIALTINQANAASARLIDLYYPSDIWPPLTQIAHWVLRIAAVALSMLLLVLVVSLLIPMVRAWHIGDKTALGIATLAALSCLAAAVYVSWGLFDRSPHILDGVSYYFQGKILASGQISAPAPPVADGFPTPFTVVHDGRWFSQYPVGVPLLLGVGFLLRCPWLIEPILAAAAVFLIFLTARRRYSNGTAVLAAVLAASSPFLALQSGTFMSHVPAMFSATLLLYAASRYVDNPQRRWALVGLAALGLMFLCRETASLIVGLPVIVYTATRVRPHWRALRSHLWVVAAMAVVTLAIYQGYNWAVTGSPSSLPRLMFFAGDTLGFGRGIGFYGQHTVAAGLVNTDQLLTSLSIVLFGWPFYTSLAAMTIPFITRRNTAWDNLCATIFLLFVVVYIAYFYHGIALGPRYYFEAFPAMIFLASRGFVCLARTTEGWLRSLRLVRMGAPRLAAVLVLAALMLCNVLYFAPRQNELYRDFTALYNGPQMGEWIDRDFAGRFPALDNALVTTSEWWIYSLYFAPLNCPNLDCAAVLAYSPSPDVDAALLKQFADRDLYRVYDSDGTIEVERVPRTEQ